MGAAIPALGDRKQIRITVIIENDHASQRVTDVLNVAAPVVIDRHEISVAILDLRRAPLVLEPAVTDLRAVGRAQQQVVGVSISCR